MCQNYIEEYNLLLQEQQPVVSVAAPNIDAIKAWKTMRNSEPPDSIAMHVIHLLGYKSILYHIITALKPHQVFNR